MLLRSVLIYIVCFTYIFANNIVLTQEEKQFLKTHNKFSVHMEDNYIPFSEIDEDGKFVGYCVDYANILASMLGIEFIYNKNENWNQAIDNLKNKKTDIIAQAVNTKQRQSFALFTKDYMRYHQSIAIKNNKKHLNTLEKLQHHKVGIVSGYYFEDIIKRVYPNIELIGFPNNKTLLNAILLDEIDAVIATHQVIQHDINSLLLKNIISVPMLDNNDIAQTIEAFAIAKNLPLLHSSLEKALNNISKKEIAKLKLKWFGNEIKNKKNAIQFLDLEKKYLIDKEQITMCIDPDWMPFEMFDENNNHIGISKDYFDIFQKELSIPIKVIKTNSWSETLQFAKSRKCDIISLAMETKSRKKYMNFTTPYLSVPLVLATKSNVSFIDDLNQLRNKDIGIVKGYALTEILKEKYPNMNIIEIDNNIIGLEKVATGDFFGFIGSIADIGYVFQTTNINDLKIVGKFKDRWELGIAIRNDDLVLLNIFNKMVNNISKDKKQQIFNKYIAIKYEKGFDYTFFWQLTIGFILSLLVLIIFILKQRKFKNEIELLNKNLELKMTQEIEKNRQKDKMIFNQSKHASMGEMIGNIAHQWRQPLNRINLSLAVIEDIIKEPNVDKKMVESKIINSQKNLQYMSDTIEDFVNFFRPEKQILKFNILETINKATYLLENRLKAINLTISCKEDIEITSYENELVQVMLIILNNALDNFELKENKNKNIRIIVSEIDDTILMELKDNGGGISKENSTKIFEPYFTTKFKSEGAGIGLYMAKTVIEDSMSGKLMMNSIGDETVFTIKLKIEKEK